MQELKHKDVTEKIIGAAFEVHKFLGNGFQEVISAGLSLGTVASWVIFCQGN
jgi:hypothetical protein